MNAQELEAEIQRHLWRIVELKAELHDEQVAVDHLAAMRQHADDETPAHPRQRQS